MATLFKPFKITKSQLNNLAIKEGQFIILTDTQEMYLDNSNTQRIFLGKAFDGSVVDYATCSTSAATAAKQVTIINKDNYELKSGNIVAVKFSETNSANNPTLNVNNTGAKNVWYNKSLITTSTVSNLGTADRVTFFMYDGTNWVWMSQSVDVSNTYTNVVLGHGLAISTNSGTTLTATLANYNLTTGGIVAVKFSNAVPANATLNINNKGAKAIYYRNTAISNNIIRAGDTATFMYNGSQYHLLTIDSTVEIYNEIVELMQTI